MTTKFTYKDKVICGPMVRISSLPFRIMALKYGADIVFSEELIDLKLMNCKRVVNEENGVIEFVTSNDDAVVWRTCPVEKGRVVVQIGTAKPETAVKAIRLIKEDVAGVDINMGCPQRFSIQAAMGVELLKVPQTAFSIVAAVRKEFPDLHLSVKIRLLDGDISNTILFCKGLKDAGCHAITLHGRLASERDKNPANWTAIRKVTDAIQTQDFPMVANGDVFEFTDIERARRETGTSGVMMCRGPMYNVARAFSSLIQKGSDDFMPSVKEIGREILEVGKIWTMTAAQAKYLLLRMANPPKKAEKSMNLFCSVQKAKSIQDLWKIFEEEEDGTPPNKRQRHD